MPAKFHSLGLHSLGRGGARLLPWLLLLLLANVMLAASSPPPLPPPKPAGPLFKERPFGPLPPPTQPPPKYFSDEEEKPIPREWVIGGSIAAVIIVGLILYGSARAWRRSNIFDQQYHFPPNRKPALRLGGSRCGGNMATLRADDAPAGGARA